MELINQKELGIFEVMTAAMHLFTKNIKKILVVVCILFLPISILHVLILDRINVVTTYVMAIMSPSATLENVAEYTNMMYQMIQNNILQAAILLFLEPVGIIAVAKLGKGYLLGQPISVQDAIGEAMSCLKYFIPIGVLYFLAMCVGGVLLVLPALIVAVFWCLYMYAIGLGEQKWKCLGYSYRLVKGKWWKTLGLILVMGCVLTGWDWAISVVYLIAPENAATDILYYTLTYLPAAYGYLVMSVLFLNREAVIMGKKHMPTKEEIVDIVV